MGDARRDSRRTGSSRGRNPNSSLKTAQPPRVPAPTTGKRDVSPAPHTLQVLHSGGKQQQASQTPNSQTTSDVKSPSSAPGSGRSWASLLSKAPQQQHAGAKHTSPHIPPPTAVADVTGTKEEPGNTKASPSEHKLEPKIEAPVSIPEGASETSRPKASPWGIKPSPPTLPGSSVAPSSPQPLSPKADLVTSPRTPRTFKFDRGHVVVIVHEAPLEMEAAEARPASAAAAAAPPMSSALQAEVPASAAPVSWAAMARATAANPPPPVAARPRPVVQKAPQNPEGKGTPPPPKGRQQKQKEKQPRERQRRERGNNKSNDASHRSNAAKPSQPPARQDQQLNSSAPEKSPQQPNATFEAAAPEEPVVVEVQELVKEMEIVALSPVQGEEAASQPSPAPAAPAPAPVVANGKASQAADKGSEEALTALCASAHTIETTLRVQPRGIQNPGNLCFVNAVLQALMGSSGFFKLMVDLRAAGPLLGADDTPVLSTLARIAAEFDKNEAVTELVSKTNKDNDASGSKEPINYKASVLLGGRPVGAGLIMDLIHRFAPGQEKCTSGDVEQEDAHEFLHFLLDRMHEELLVLQKQRQLVIVSAAASSLEESSHNPAGEEQVEQEGGQDEDEDEDGWLVQSGKRAVRQQEVSAAPEEASTVVTSLVQGKLATSVSCAGTPASVTVHPFKVIGLPINLDSVKSIGDAIEELTAAETISGYKPNSGASPRDAAKSERFSHVPDLLVLHLMRFQYTSRSAKVNKFVSFDTKLPMRSSWLAPGSKERGVVYQLVSTVTHHGKSIGSGHYTADVVQKDGRWLRFDDGNVFWVGQNTVLAERPYLLVYQKILASHH